MRGAGNYSGLMKGVGQNSMSGPAWKITAWEGNHTSKKRLGLQSQAYSHHVRRGKNIDIQGPCIQLSPSSRFGIGRVR